MKARFATLLLAAAAAIGGLLVPGAASAQSDVTANLRVLTMGGAAQEKSIGNAVARFNKEYPNVKVEVAIDPISSGWGDYITRVLSQYKAGNAADVYGTAIETFRAFESRGLFIPLDDYIAKNPSYADFDPALFKYGSYQGKTYFVPIGWNNIMINYNRKLFTEAGVPFPKNDWTWQDFRQAAIKLTKRDGSGNVTQFGYEVPNQNFFVQPWFFSNGTAILKDDWSHSNMLDPKVSETLQFLHDLIHIDKVSPIPGKDTMDNQFAAGQIAMISRGAWILHTMREAKVDMDIVTPPGNVTHDTVIGFGAYAVSKDSKNPDLALALLKELTSFETQKEDGEAGGSVPGSKAAAETPGFLEFPPSANMYYATLPHTQPVPSPANFQEVEKIFIRYYVAMMSDEMTIAEGVKRCNDELEASFARLAAK